MLNEVVFKRALPPNSYCCDLSILTLIYRRKSQI